MSAPRNIGLCIEYDGSGLAGWQAQVGQPSVAGHLQAALHTMTGEHGSFGCAGRTDAGVHARAQLAHFRTAVPWPARRFTTGFNHLLPRQIKVLDAWEAAADFVPRRAARGKLYRYTVLSAPHAAPLLADRAWHLRRRLDVERMRLAADSMLGEHDFSAFRHAHCDAAHARRRMLRLRVRQRPRPPGGSIVTIDLMANAFCRHMCRIIVGTLVQVGAGTRPVDSVAELLRQGDRTAAGSTAPAHGLCLMRVFVGRRRHEG